MIKIQKYSLALLVCLPLSVEAATFRWTDTDGIVHYSNAVPASDSQLGHVELSKSGIKKKTVISAAMKRALKADADAKAQKLIADKAEGKRLKAQEEEEIRLLSIFASEEEVVQSYNSKLRMAQLTIDLLKSRHKVQSQKLEKLETKFEHMKELKNKRAIESQMDDVLDNLRIYQQAITENLIEKDKVHKDFRETLNRYKRLVARMKTSAK